MKTGVVVWYNTEDGHDYTRDRLGLFVRNAGNKDVIQTADGAFVELGYREPENNKSDRGRTWWKVK